MKRVILTIAIMGTMLTACSDNGNQAETSDAEDVVVVETEQTVTYETVSATSEVEWRASHLGGISPRYGILTLKSASLSVTDDVLTNATIIMDMNSLRVDSFGDDKEQADKLTGHLLSEDFFTTDVYPTSTFELTSIADATGDYTSNVTGNLTILDITKSITFAANVSISDNEVSILSEDFAVDRSDWGLVYNAEGTDGVPTDYLISDDIGFTIDVTVSK